MSMARREIALTVAGWAARVLSLGAAFLILSMWFLVPNNPDSSATDNLWSKLRPIAMFTLALVALLLFARWCFVKRDQQRKRP